MSPFISLHKHLKYIHADAVNPNSCIKWNHKIHVVFYFMINLQESMGPGWDPTRDPWICSQTRICCQNLYLESVVAKTDHFIDAFVR